MFYCSDCQKQNGWPESFFMSYGPCEMCGKSAPCYDVKSCNLPKDQDALEEARLMTERDEDEA